MKFLFLLLSCLVLSLPSTGISADKEMHIFLLIGQSNMAGRAKLKPGDDTTISNCKLWNGKSWEEAKAPFNRYATIKKGGFTQGMNPGPEFVKAYQKANPNVQVGIINWARGGSSIEQWDPGKNLYQSAVKQTKSALKLGGKLKGILWHQGESNSKKAAQYPKLLKAHVERLRKEFSAPNLHLFLDKSENGTKATKTLMR